MPPLRNGATSHGGILIHTGVDANADGVLDEAETTRNERVCHGEVGASGLTSMLVLNAENDAASCPNGGVRE